MLGAADMAADLGSTGAWEPVLALVSGASSPPVLWQA